MPKFPLLAVCCVVLFGGAAGEISAQEKQALRLVRTIPLPEVTGRLDHMGVDLEKKRLFVAAVTNNTLEVVDLSGGKVIQSLTGMKSTQDALFLGGDFNKLYVSSNDGHVRIFQGETFRLVQKDPDHYDVISKIKTRPGSGTSLWVPQLNAFYVASQAIDAQKAAILVFEPAR